MAEALNTFTEYLRSRDLRLTSPRRVKVRHNTAMQIGATSFMAKT